MARWLQLGDRKFNMDQICAIRKEGDTVRVTFVGLCERELGVNFEIKGDDAKRLWNAARDETRIQ